MKKTIANTVSDKIKKGEVTMRTQLSIWAEKIRIDGSILVLFTSLILIVGFIFYWINSNNDLLLGGYGQYGLSSFFQSFPYLFVICFIALFISLIFIFRTFDFSYKKPLILPLLLVGIGILVLGWLSIKQPIGQRFYQQEGRMLGMGMMNNSNAVSGIVVEVNQKTITIQNEDNKKTIINLSENTHYPFGKPKIGNQARSVGTWEGDRFDAFGVRIFDESNPATLGPCMMRNR